MAYLDRDGIRIYYEDRGSGPAVLLTHGYSATCNMWKPQVDALADRYRFITWDMRGHGQTDSPDDASRYSEAVTVADMRALLDASGVRRAVVGGLSLGGYMSLAFYRTHPEMVEALLLADTGPGYRNPAARDGWNQMAQQRAREFEEQGLAALGQGSEVRIALHRSAQGLAHAARGMLAQVDDRVISVLPEVRVPTLVVVGEQDEPFRAPSDYMAAKVPAAELVIIPTAGHASNLDQPDRFNEALSRFLGKVAG